MSSEAFSLDLKHDGVHRTKGTCSWKAFTIWEFSIVRGKICVTVTESAWPDKSCFPFQCSDGTVFPGPLMG